jgi:rubredoxin
MTQHNNSKLSTERLRELTRPIRGNTGHGHVWPRPDKRKARCGGPGLCPACSIDKVNFDRDSHSETVLMATELLALREAETPAEAGAGFKLVPEEMTGPMWVAGRKMFETEAERYRTAPSTALAMAYADRAPEHIWEVMLAAAPSTTTPEVSK